MHLANTVDNTYEWGIGWIRTILCSVVAAMTVSAIETNSDFSLWEWTVEWGYQQLRDFGNWLIDLVS
jgi:hypothetical protein